MGETWRERARPIIQQVLAECAEQDEKTIRRALRDAYPFGPRAHHPYKAWCDEVNVQMGTKKAKPVEHDPNQTDLFSLTAKAG